MLTNAEGMIPTTVYSSSSNFTRRPTRSGRESKALCQREWLITSNRRDALPIIGRGDPAAQLGAHPDEAENIPR